MSTDVRCEPGQSTIEWRCTWHPVHYWCAACSGYYGVPHELYDCHTWQAKRGFRRLPVGSTSPSPGQCACRFCKDADANTWQIAFDMHSASAPVSDHHPARVVDLAYEWCGIEPEPFPELAAALEQARSAFLMLRANHKAGNDGLMKFDWWQLEDALSALWRQYLLDTASTYDGDDAF